MITGPLFFLDKNHTAIQTIKPFVNQKSLLSILCLLLVNTLFAQTEYLVGHIGLKDGLSSQLCSHILEDDKGNLWISTYQDVQRYDGYSVTVFPQFAQSNNNKPINDLLKDARGNIWVLQGDPDIEFDLLNMTGFFVDGGVHIIDATADTTYSLKDYIGEHNFGELEIVKIFSRGTTFFICTSDHRVFKYVESLELHATLQDIKKVVTVSEAGDIIYIGADGLRTMGSNNNSELLLPSEKLDNYDNIFSSRKGELFLTAEQADSVSVHEFRDSQVHYISTFEKELFTHIASRPTTIERYGPNIILVWNRLFEIKKGGKSVEIRLARTQRLISEYIVSRSGLSLAATDLGIYILNTNRNRFKNLASNNDSLNSVRAFYTDPDLTLYREGDEKVIGYSTKYDFGFLENNDLGYLAYHHYRDPTNEDHIWSVGLFDDFVIRKIDLSQKQVESIEVTPKSAFTPNHLLRSTQSGTLYMSSTGRPCYFDESAKVFRILNLDCLENTNIETNHMIEKNGEIWFAGVDGIIQYSEESKTCKLKRVFPESESYVIQYIHEDRLDSRIVWLGTRRGGLVKWDIETDSIQIFNMGNGLSNDDVHAIIEDNSERLWIPTNRNLNTFDKRSDSFFHFTEADGLSHSEFNKYSYFYDTHQNQIYFGGLNGYNYFNPDSITTSQNDQIKLRIIDVTKIGREGKIEDVYTETLKANAISVMEHDLSVQVQLATNYLLNPSETKYSYRIPGFLDDWRTESSNVINLNRLPYGNYKLEFIADMHKFTSMSNILSIDMNVDVPWWKTWTFYFLTALGAIGLIWLGVRRYNKGIIERNIKLEEMVSLRTKELQEVVKTKNKIFTILAHDLRIPISGLSNLSDKVRFLISKDRYSDLNQIALETEKRVKALNDNLSNILVWAVSENSTLSIQPKSLFLNTEIDKVLQLYAHEVEKKNLKINLDLLADDRVYMDLTILQTLLRNFLHNAIKFSRDGGKINITLSPKDDSWLVLKLEDFGIGMETNEIRNPSSANQEIRNKGKGLGLGMMISQELAEKAGIRINVVSEKNIGTGIYLTLPR